MTADFVENYINEVKNEICRMNRNPVYEVIDTIFEAYRGKRQVFIMGNGGSAATASHFACDLAKGTIVEGKERFRIICLNDNIALLTAFSNDYGYEHVFSEQLKNLVNMNDVVIAISASGNSANIINCIAYAHEKSAKVIGFTGFDGGKLKKLSDLCIHLDNYNYGQVEDIHMFLCHMISQGLKEKILLLE